MDAPIQLPRLRVRQLLAAATSQERKGLLALIPEINRAAAPTTPPLTPPKPILACFPAAAAYSLLGYATEELLRLPEEDITERALLETVRRFQPAVKLGQLQKAKAVAADFLAALRTTRKKMEAVLSTEGASEFFYDQVLAAGSVEGHPDAVAGPASPTAITYTHLFEVKCCSYLEPTKWQDFLLQLYAYGALSPTATDLFLVLPLHTAVLHWTTEAWGPSNRRAYLAALQAASTRIQSAQLLDATFGASLRARYRIGHHVAKAKTLEQTLAGLPDYACPYQIFLGAPHNTRMALKDADLAAAAQMVERTGVKLYVHSQYIINLCAKTADDWNASLLIKNVQAAASIGCRGVVVHVGKSVKTPLPEALEQMRATLLEAIQHATPSCPVLLETPAGQGTETLTAESDFIDFVNSFDDARLRICLDTCHVFACGHQPTAYIRSLTTRPGLLQLVHYNDSATPCGSCVDRHAFMGTGHIGMEGMRAIAELCDAAAVPMVIE